MYSFKTLVLFVDCHDFVMMSRHTHLLLTDGAEGC